MTDNRPDLDPANQDNAPVAEPAPTETPAPVEVSPDESAADVSTEVSVETPEVNAQPVSGVPTPGGVGDPKPEQTDNTERPEDGAQDVSQDTSVVPSNDEDPDAAA